jgi:hypothetical protein
MPLVVNVAGAFGDTRLELEAAFLTSSMPGWAPTSRPSSGPLAGPSSSANHLVGHHSKRGSLSPWHGSIRTRISCYQDKDL